MSIYLTRPERTPDSAFEPGELHHLVIGNSGRLLDPRRTPVSIVDLRPVAGFFEVRIDDFEDAGTTWEIPFEKVCQYQFARGAARASDAQVSILRETIARLDRTLSISCDDATRRATSRRLEVERQAAIEWLESESLFFRERGRFPDVAGRAGDERLYRDLDAYMSARGLGHVEAAFARQYVSNPYSGELVKGHRIVLAELGLVPYEGRAIRDPALFDGGWSREHRAGHVLTRLAFVRAVYDRLGLDRIVLYRGLSTEAPLERPGNVTFVSATFSEAVARSHYEAGSEHSTRLLMRQAVDVVRVFMTYLETAQMNGRFKEAEAVLLYDGDNVAF